MLDICRAQLVDASTSTAHRSRSSSTSDTLSTSVTFRLSGGCRRSHLRKFQNIYCCVLVAIHMCAAAITFELPDFQTTAGVNVATDIAPSARRKEPVGYTQFPAIPRTLVSQHLPEHAEAGATQTLGQFGVLHHVARCEVFNSQHVKPAHQGRGQLVERVLPAVGNLGVQPRHLQPLLIPSATALDATGENPLQASKALSVPSSISRIGNTLPVGESCQPRDSQVDPDLSASLGECSFGWFIQAKTHEVSPGAVLGYRDCCGFTCETATPFDVETTDFGNFKSTIRSVPVKSVNRVRHTLSAVLGLKTGIRCSLCKEVRERGLQMPQRLLLWYAGRLHQPYELRIVAVYRQSCTTGVIITRFTGLKTVCPQLQSKVVGMSSATEFPGELSCLTGCRIESEWVINFHLTQNYYTV